MTKEDEIPKWNKKDSVQKLWKIIKNKSSSYQIKDEDLNKSFIPLEKQDKIREAISKVYSNGTGCIFAPIKWLFEQITNFLDTVFKIVFVLFIYILSLQLPYINENANKKLEEIVFQAEKNLIKYNETVVQFKEVFAKYKISQSNAEKEIPETIKQDKIKADIWLAYKDKTVEFIWSKIFENPFGEKNKINDLQYIYSESLKNYSPGLPTNKSPYINSGLISLVFLLIYLITQSLILLFIKKQLKYLIFKHEVNKVL